MHIDDHFTAASTAPLDLTVVFEGDGDGNAILERMPQLAGTELG